MNAFTLSMSSLATVAPLRGIRRHLPHARTGAVTTGLIVLAAVLSFVGSVAWAQDSPAAAPRAQAAAKPATSARASVELARAPNVRARRATTSTPAPWARPAPPVLCACVRDKTRA
jgi:hypothetical protein